MTRKAFFKVKQPPAVPVHFLVLALLVTYVVIHGIVSGHSNLIHYYWLVGLVFLFSIHYWINIDGSIARYVLKGIVWAALLECLVVFLQYFGLVPPEDPLFRCTGSWINPNVTAVFLAMAFYAVVKPRLFNRPILPIAAAGAVIAAILFLQCRSALFMVFLFASARFGKELIDMGHRRLGVSKTTLITVIVISGVMCLSWLAFGMKQASTSGRWQIWKNCLPLIAERPVFGHGFGSFEKEYNLFIAARGLPSNDHVNMPYNDFLGLAVEGGICAVFLWGAMLFTIIRNTIKSGRFFCTHFCLYLFAAGQFWISGYSRVCAAFGLHGDRHRRSRKTDFVQAPARSFCTDHFHFVLYPAGDSFNCRPAPAEPRQGLLYQK